MRRILATIGAALAIGVVGGVLVGASLSEREQRTITASSTDMFSRTSPANDLKNFGKF